MSGRYHRPHKWSWFLDRPNYRLFMIRELTSVFIAGYLVVLLITLAKLGGGEAAFGAWLQAMSSPVWMGIHAISLLAAIWHSVTWFNAVPQAMPLYIGEKRVAAPLAAFAMGYGPWITVSALIAWGVLR